MALYGGGNTSLKTTWLEANGARRPCLLVKGSGNDLAEVSAADFAPVDLSAARALLRGPEPDDHALKEALLNLRLDPVAPRPSIETLMHAALPYRYVEHTHADAVLALVNTEGGEALARQVFGARAPLVPFRQSGFALAAACADTWTRDATPATEGLLLAFHGVVAGGDTARESFDRLYGLAGLATEHLRRREAWTLPREPAPARTLEGALRLARLRSALSREAGFPVVTCVDDSPEAVAFCRRTDLDPIALQGPPTPQHAVFTKRLPCLGGDVAAYARAYRDYARLHGGGLPAARVPDAAPRVVLLPDLGVVAASVDGRHARMTATVYHHDLAIATRASAHDRYRSLPAADILAAEVHYGGFDRARLERRGDDLPLLGCVVGLAAMADRGTVEALAQRLVDLGADLLWLDRPQAALDAAWSCGGLDALLQPVTGARAPEGAEALLQVSSGGGFVAALDSDRDSLTASLVRHWRAVTGVSAP